MPKLLADKVDTLSLNHPVLYRIRSLNAAEIAQKSDATPTYCVSTQYLIHDARVEVLVGPHGSVGDRLDRRIELDPLFLLRRRPRLFSPPAKRRKAHVDDQQNV